MTPKQLEKRKRTILLGLQIGKTHTFSLPDYFTHHRSYLQGYIRCVNCKKWIDPNNPEEAKEILIVGGGRRQHHPLRCPVNSEDPAVFATVPRFHGTRRRRLETIKRY